MKLKNTNKIKLQDKDLILEIQKELKEYHDIKVDCENIILTNKVIAIQNDNLIYLLKTFTKDSNIQNNQIIYGI